MKKLAIVSPNRDYYSETFIKSQIDYLPFNSFSYSGGYIPQFQEGNSISTAESLTHKIYYKILRLLRLTSLKNRELDLARSFKKNKIEIVLAQYGPTGESICKVCKELKIPLVVHFHGYDSTVSSVIEANNKYNNIFTYARKIIAVSQKMKADLVQIGCPPEKIECHPCAPNNNFFSIIPDLKGYHFVGIGRFTNKKAPYYTILAFSKILDKYPDARLTIGGDGELFDTCINLVRYLGIEHAVTLPGVLNPEQFAALLSRSIAFVQHSVVTGSGDSEGAPVAILEASAAGVPVISTRHAGIPEIVLDGVTGLLVNEHDVDGMATAMLTILDSTELRKYMSENGRNFIAQRYTMKSYIDKVASVLFNSLDNT